MCPTIRKAGDHNLTAADPLPDDLCNDSSRSAKTVRTNLS